MSIPKYRVLTTALEAALQDEPSSTERRHMEDMAGTWSLCACGEACKDIPKRADGRPIDKQLRRWGAEFYRLIELGEWQAALDIGGKAGQLNLTHKNMKLTIQSKPLLGALEKLRPIFSGRTTLPCISNVLLSAKDDTLTISANNLDIYGAVSVKADIVEPGEIAVVGIRLLSAVKYSAENISLEVKDGKLHFSSGEAKNMRLLGLPAAELPQPLTCSAEKGFDIDGGAFTKALGEVLPFVSSDSARFILNGIFLQGGDCLHLVATNGLALSVRKIDIGDCKDFKDAIIPTEACRLISTIEGAARLSSDGNSFNVSSENTLITGKLIAGNYPNWRQVVPSVKECEVRVFVDRKSVLAALPFIEASIVDRVYSKIHATIGKKELTLEFKAVGEDKTINTEASDTLPATVTGKGFEAAFNGNLFRSILESIDAPEVTLLFRDAMSPMLVESSDGQNVMMLMRVG